MTDERHASLGVFDPSKPVWLKGTRLAGVAAQEGVVSGILVPESVVVRIEGESQPLIRNVDYAIDPVWGTIGRTETGRLNESSVVSISYDYVPPRVDTVVLQTDGTIALRAGTPSNTGGLMWTAGPGEKILGRVDMRGPISGLAVSNLFPVLTIDSGKSARTGSVRLSSSLQEFLSKLRSGRPVRILAWGDSVTEGAYMPNPQTDRWQERFLVELKRVYPNARVTMLTEAWPGRGSADYLNAGLDHPRNLAKSVLGLKPDLVISEFVNDAYLDQAATAAQYRQFHGMFRSAGIAWVVMTPHFTHPDMMGYGADSTGGYDPRPYIAGLKDFGMRNGVDVADASALWAALKRQGVPYMALLSNGINHPDAAGQDLYAQALMKLFTS